MIYDDYIGYTKKYRQEYGDQTVVMIEVGSFWEFYDCNNGYGANIKDICGLLNIQLSKKNKNIQEVSSRNPYMAGFPTPALQKYLPILLQNDYTVVLVSQVTPPPNPKRAVTHIYSKGTVIDEITANDSQNIMCLYFEKASNAINIGIAVMDLTTGEVYVSQTYSPSSDANMALDEAHRLISEYAPCELILIGSKPNSFTIEELLNYLNASSIKLYDMFGIYNHEVHDTNYQNYMLSLAYPHQTMLSSIEYINLERHQNATVALVACLQYAFKHNESIIKQLQLPKLLSKESKMILDFNASKQLDLEGLNRVLNKCITRQGKRYFRFRLFNPIADVHQLNLLYKSIEQFKSYSNLRKHLCKISDLDKFTRKIITTKMNPFDIRIFYDSMMSIQELIEEAPLPHTHGSKEDLLSTLQEMIDAFDRTLDLDECSRHNTDDIKANIFKKGYQEHIDAIAHDVESINSELTVFLEKLNQNSKSPIFKLDSNDKEGLYLLITTKRAHETQVMFDNFSFEFSFISSSFTGSTCQKTKLLSSYTKITHKSLEELHKKKCELLSYLQNEVTLHFQNFLKDFISLYMNKITNLNDYVSVLDFEHTSALNAQKFSYCLPNFIHSPSHSFVSCKDLRHPIIERVLEHISYVPNDISLGEDKHHGILLYGLNAAGKSSLMKAVGLGVIMAQAGMYAPSSSFESSPFHSLFTRIEKGDNIYTGQSTFMIEMSELRNILARANEKSLVIGDELCSGTESASAIAIVSAGIVELSRRRSIFIFATHLHDLTKIKQVSELQNVGVYHLHVEYDPSTQKLLYNRKLQPGQGQTTYGLEVCKALNLEKSFIMLANNIRSQYLDIVSENGGETKRSVYNSKIIVDKCVVCGNKGKETHHIKQKKDANIFKMIGSVNMNHQSNLVYLCENCHHNVHNGKLNINGYKQTSDGVQLDFSHSSFKNKHDINDMNVMERVKTFKKEGMSNKQILMELEKENIMMTNYKLRKCLNVITGF